MTGVMTSLGEQEQDNGCRRHDVWLLSPEGAAVHEARRLAVIADVHLGYEWARGEQGDAVPSHSLGETIAKLDRLTRRLPGRIETVLVAGDLVESCHWCPRTQRDRESLVEWLARRGMRLLLLRGNHDPIDSPIAPSRLEMDGWTIGHGHESLPGDRIVIGHHHPCLKAEGRHFPCFVAGPRLLVLPAWSDNAAGVAPWIVQRAIEPRWSRGQVHCLASDGELLLDFGPCRELEQALVG